MKIYNSSQNIDKIIINIVNILEKDGVMVYPTDTVYGFGSSIFSKNAINKIEKLKNRKSENPFSICVPSKEYLYDKVIINDKIKKIVDKFLPGAITLILPTKKNVLPKYFYSENVYVGYRIPDNAFCMKLLEKFDKPIISTSINLSGHEPMNNINEIVKQFSNKVQIYIKDKGLEKKNNSVGSTIIKVSKDENLSLIRQGEIPFLDIIEFSN